MVDGGGGVGRANSCTCFIVRGSVCGGRGGSVYGAYQNAKATTDAILLVMSCTLLTQQDVFKTKWAATTNDATVMAACDQHCASMLETRHQGSRGGWKGARGRIFACVSVERRGRRQRDVDVEVEVERAGEEEGRKGGSGWTDGRMERIGVGGVVGLTSSHDGWCEIVTLDKLSDGWGVGREGCGDGKRIGGGRPPTSGSGKVSICWSRPWLRRAAYFGGLFLSG